MPRSWSNLSMPGWASWLLGAPATILARKGGTLGAVSAPPDARGGGLVVGRPCNDFGTKGRHAGVVQRAAERAGGVDVDVGGDQGGRVGHDVDLRVRLADPVDRLRRAVGGDHGGTVLDQVRGQVAADLAEAGHADR